LLKSGRLASDACTAAASTRAYGSGVLDFM
jgi:hypothetical protein